MISSLSPPTSSDDYGILITRWSYVIGPVADWEIYNKQLVCVGSPNHVTGKSISVVRSTPILIIISRPHAGGEPTGAIEL